jgi:hypothetical protein
MRPGRALILSSAALLLVPFLGAGCGSSAAQGAATLPVKGKVVLKGKPLTKGTIRFEPEGAGKEGFGEIQPDGTFVLTTYKKDDGAVVGNHRVSINTIDKSVPVKYGSPNTSKLEIEVSEGKTDYTIDLK